MISLQSLRQPSGFSNMALYLSVINNNLDSYQIPAADKFHHIPSCFHLSIVILRLTFAIIAGVLHHYFFLPLRPQHGLQSCQPTSLSAISTQALASYTSSHSAGYRWASQPTVSQSCSFNIPSSIKPDNISLLGLYARSRFICRAAL